MNSPEMMDMQASFNQIQTIRQIRQLKEETSKEYDEI